MSTENKHSQNGKAGIVGLIGGVLMIVGGVTGAATWRNIGEQTIEITGIQALGQIFQILVLLGSLGGVFVIFGSLYISLSRVKVGKVMIAIGAGFGIIGLLIFVLLTLLGDDPLGNFLGAIGLGFVGLVCSIYARQKSG